MASVNKLHATSSAAAWPAAVEVRRQSPELGASALALRDYELDCQFTGSLQEAEREIAGALHMTDGHAPDPRQLADDLRQLVRVALADIRRQPAVRLDSRYRFRLLNTGESLSALLPQNSWSRIAVIPIGDAYSYHADARPETAHDLTAQIGALGADRFTFVASPAVAAGDPDADFIALRQPLSPEQLARYRVIARLISQARVDVANQGLEAQAGLGAALGGIRNAAARLVTAIRNYQTEIDRRPAAQAAPVKNGNAAAVVTSARAVRRSAVDLAQGIKGQLGNAGLSAVMYQTLRSGLQQLQQLKTEAGQQPPVKLQLQKRAAPAPAAGSNSPTPAPAVGRPSQTVAVPMNRAQATPVAAAGQNPVGPSPRSTATMTATIIDFRQAAAAVRAAPRAPVASVVPLAAAPVADAIIAPATARSRPNAEPVVRSLAAPPPPSELAPAAAPDSTAARLPAPVPDTPSALIEWVPADQPFFLAPRDKIIACRIRNFCLQLRRLRHCHQEMQRPIQLSPTI